MYKVWVLTLFLACCCLSEGCMSQRTLERKAVTRAREFVSDNMRDLSEKDLSFIRYSTPEWQSSPLFRRVAVDNSYNWTTQMGVPLDATTTDFNTLAQHTSKQRYGCFVWRLPGKNTCVMVSGICYKDMSFFEPLRVVRRPINFGDPNKSAVLEQVRDHLLQELAVMHVRKNDNEVVRDRVRFVPPLVIESAFLSDLPPKSEREYSFLWSMADESDVLCLSGFAPPDFSSFTVKTARVRKLSDIPENVKTIGNFGELSEFSATDKDNRR